MRLHPRLVVGTSPPHVRLLSGTESRVHAPVFSCLSRLSPELYMRRPSQEKYRLDNILKKKASEGVKIYVIV